MVSTNITTRQSTGVAINVAVLIATLQAIKQRVLRIMVNRPLGPMGRWMGGEFNSPDNERRSHFYVQFTIYNVQSSMVNRQWSMVNGQWSITRLYRHQLRMTRAVARMIDKHPALSNIALWLMGIGIMVEIFMFV